MATVLIQKMKLNSGESHAKNHKDKLASFPSVTRAKQPGLLVNTLGSHS